MPCSRNFCRVGTVSHEYHLAVTRINLNLARKIRKRRQTYTGKFSCDWNFEDKARTRAAAKRQRAWRVEHAAPPWNRDSWWLRENRMQPLSAAEAKSILRGLH